MDYKELVEHLNEWNENLISELCGDDVLTCDDLCGCTCDCIVVQAATAITDLLARAEAAEKRVEELEKSLSDAAQVVKTMQESTITFYERRAEKAERELKAYKEMIYKERPCFRRYLLEVKTWMV